MVEIRLLGDIEVRTAGRIVDVGHARQRSVLAVLATEANRVVHGDHLVDRVWGEQQLPVYPAGALQTYISLLRRSLAVVKDATITWQAPGYKMTIDAQDVDLHRFNSLVSRANSANDDEAAALLEQALALWHGEPFAGLDTPWAAEIRAMLTMQRQAARSDLTDIQLRRGQHGKLLGLLAGQVAQCPLDERVTGQYMLALYRCGRQADALKCYERTRCMLAEELGADPGPSLQLLHHQILTADHTLDLPGERAGPEASRPLVPCQLPAAPRQFAGRSDELTRLTAMLGDGTDPSGVAKVAAICGTGGIGKTWLALRWAYQHMHRFPDGQLWVNLQGFEPSAPSVLPLVAVRRILASLGARPAEIPADTDAASGLYRSLVAGKRMLVVLDNARDTGQVIPLLPGSPTCIALVTSRYQLTGLVTAHGAWHLNLDTLTDDEARELLASHLGPEPLATESDAVESLLACCGGLPLALSVVAARAALHPGFPLALLASELREASTRLDALDTEDLTSSVRAALSLSYGALEPRAAKVFSQLGLIPGPDISVPAAASLTRLPVHRVRAVMGALEAASLVRQHVPGRYRMHDLVRLYAVDKAGSGMSKNTKVAALQRVTDFYLHSAFSGDRLLHPHRPSVEIGRPAAGCYPLAHASKAEALSWFDAEHPCLLAAQEVAVQHSWHSCVWQFAWALNAFHTFRGHCRERIETWRIGIAAAEELGAASVQALAHGWLGQAYAQSGFYDEALGHLERAVCLANDAGDITSLAYSHLQLARACGLRGSHRKALEHARCALELFQPLARPAWEAQALSSIGWHQAHIGHLDQARVSCEAALALYRQVDDLEGEAATLDSLGYIALLAGFHETAREHYQQALSLCRDLGHTYIEADIQASLAAAYAACNELDKARKAWGEALRLYKIQRRTADAAHIQQQLDGVDGLTS